MFLCQESPPKTISFAKATWYTFTTPQISERMPGRQVSFLGSGVQLFIFWVSPHSGGAVCSTLWVWLLLPVPSHPECSSLLPVGPLGQCIGKVPKPRVPTGQPSALALWGSHCCGYGKLAPEDVSLGQSPSVGKQLTCLSRGLWPIDISPLHSLHQGNTVSPTIMEHLHSLSP